MTDDQFRQLMDKMDEILRRLPPVNYVGKEGIAGHPNTCANCGGYHGPGVLCPFLSPTVVVGKIDNVEAFNEGFIAGQNSAAVSFDHIRKGEMK